MQEKAAIKKRMQKKLMMSYVNKKTSIGGLGSLTAKKPEPASVYRHKDGKEDEACDSAGTEEEEEQPAPDPFKGVSPEV